MSKFCCYRHAAPVGDIMMVVVEQKLSRPSDEVRPFGGISAALIDGVAVNARQFIHSGTPVSTSHSSPLRLLHLPLPPAIPRPDVKVASIRSSCVSTKMKSISKYHSKLASPQQRPTNVLRTSRLAFREGDIVELQRGVSCSSICC